MSHLTRGPKHAAPESYDTAPLDRVEPKVKAATGGAAAGAVLSTFLIWLADQLWWGGEESPPDVPLPVGGFIALVATSALTFLSGWLARHVNRTT